MIEYEITCPICGTKYMGVTFGNCPICDWMFWGGESELEPEEYDETNFTSINKAKENFARGLNIWGKPIKNIQTAQQYGIGYRRWKNE